jgi:hypothetical protein
MAMKILLSRHSGAGSLNGMREIAQIRKAFRWDCSRVGKTKTVENSEEMEKIYSPASTVGFCEA